MQEKKNHYFKIQFEIDKCWLKRSIIIQQKSCNHNNEIPHDSMERPDCLYITKISMYLEKLTCKWLIMLYYFNNRISHYSGMKPGYVTNTHTHTHGLWKKFSKSYPERA